LEKTTEAESNYQSLETLSVNELLTGINNEDKTVAFSVEKAIPQIEQLVLAIKPKMQAGGRLFYIGAGTSGRLGIVDASECPPTFGVDFNLVIGIIAGGDKAIRKAVENAEDNPTGAINDLATFNLNPKKDSIIGIAASGSTPYVVEGINYFTKNGFTTGCITCNKGSALAKVSKHPIEVVVGPEFVTGSTRMKAGTAQKMVLNMISTTLMISLGKVKGNKMVDMQLSNQKLVERGTKMIMEQTQLNYQEAKNLLLTHKNVRKAVDSFFGSTQN
jgi:N-acetylmuramic acid 6-phosphate etherase